MKLKINKLINILLESRQLRIAAKRAELNESFIELSQKIEDLGLYKTRKVVSSQIDSAAHIMEALDDYCSKLPRKPNPRDLKACVELFEFFEEKKNWIATNPDGLQERISFYIEKTTAQINESARNDAREDIRKIYFELGNQAYEVGDWNAAIRYFDKAQKITLEKDPNIAYNKACVLDAAPNTLSKTVIKAYTRAAELMEDLLERKSPKIENNRGVLTATRMQEKDAKSKHKLFKKSIKSFNKAISAESSCFEAHYNLGRLYQIAGDSQEINEDPKECSKKAITYFEKALDIQHSEDIHKFLAVEYFKLSALDDEGKAKDYLKNAKKHAKAYITSLSKRISNQKKS